MINIAERSANRLSEGYLTPTSLYYTNQLLLRWFGIREITIEIELTAVEQRRPLQSNNFGLDIWS